jgi:hypothetical protein
MAAYIVITREKTRNRAKLEEYKKLAPVRFQHTRPPIFAPFIAVVKSWKEPRLRTLSLSNFPAMTQRWLGITAQNTKPHPSTVSMAETTASSPHRGPAGQVFDVRA